MTLLLWCNSKLQQGIRMQGYDAQMMYLNTTYDWTRGIPAGSGIVRELRVNARDNLGTLRMGDC